MTILIVIIVIAIVGIWLVSLYNRLVKLRNNRENAFADIDVQLKQRHDLIPQLVATVKGYAAHEKETLDRVVSARNGAMTAQTIDDKIKAENLLSAALNGLKVTVEAYPDLKANQNFMHLQEEIAHVVEAVRQRRVAGLGSFFGDDDVGAPYYERLHLFALEKIHHVGVYHFLRHARRSHGIDNSEQNDHYEHIKTEISRPVPLRFQLNFTSFGYFRSISTPFRRRFPVSKCRYMAGSYISPHNQGRSRRRTHPRPRSRRNRL